MFELGIIIVFGNIFAAMMNAKVCCEELFNRTWKQGNWINAVAFLVNVTCAIWILSLIGFWA